MTILTLLKEAYIFSIENYIPPTSGNHIFSLNKNGFTICTSAWTVSDLSLENVSTTVAIFTL